MNLDNNSISKLILSNSLRFNTKLSTLNDNAQLKTQAGPYEVKNAHNVRQEGQTDSITSKAMDSDQVVLGQKDGIARVQIKENGLQIKEMVGHSNSILAIAINDKYILTGSQDMSVKLWDKVTLECIRTYKYDEPVKIVKFINIGGDQTQIVTATIKGQGRRPAIINKINTDQSDKDQHTIDDLNKIYKDIKFVKDINSNQQSIKNNNHNQKLILSKDFKTNIQKVKSKKHKLQFKSDDGFENIIDILSIN